MKVNHTYLLKCCAQKNQSAFKQLHDDTCLRLYRIAFRILKNHHLAEETLQESYLKIWLKAGTFNTTKKPAIAWMSVIIKNTALDKLRSEKARPNLFGDMYSVDNITSSELTPDSLLFYYKETKSHLDSLKNLKSQEKNCLFFFNYYGFSHDELSARLKVPLGTIKSWVRRKPLLINQASLP